LQRKSAMARSSQLDKDQEDTKKQSQNLHEWKQKSRYMKAAAQSAARTLQGTKAREVRSFDWDTHQSPAQHDDAYFTGNMA
jgi:hypothetical protein